jgi:N-acetylglucosamine-6-phosphate deacetylase
MQIFSAAAIFTGKEWLQNHAVIISDGIIEKIVPQTELDVDSGTGNDLLLVPAFIDAQVYGAAGKLLAVYPEAETLALMNEVFSKQGTILSLPTLATNTIEVFKQGIDAVKAYWKKGGKGVYGLHLEGPWLNAEKRGAHVKELIHAPTVEEVNNLLDYAGDVVKMITIAPECCTDEVIGLLLSKNIILSAGHSNASYEQSTNCFEKGISSVTHLYNAMSALHHREPGLVGATLDHAAVKASIIPDGHHVDYAAIRLAKKIMKERLFAITDAVTETETGPYRHQLNVDKYECNGVLSGSALSMHQAFLNLVNEVGIEVDEALRMCSLYPAQVLRCDNRYGKIAPGYVGQFLLLNKQLQLVDVITS